MAYNLPPPWDPGYAQTPNMKAEGLQRRALITKWSPRGTYDSSVNPTGGYRQPQYVMDEGVGQGALVTDWVPSGTYMGPRVPHWQNQRSKLYAGAPGPAGSQYVNVVKTGLGDVSSAAGEAKFPEPFHSYGQKAATHILSRLQVVPKAQRKAQLQRVLHAIDPTLWPRAAAITQRLMKKGLPPTQALHGGIARAMSAGFIAELHHTGKSGARPKGRSQMGLGCYGCGSVLSALGAVPAALASGAKVNTRPNTATTGVSGAQDGTATADGKLIYVRGTWRIRAQADAPVATFGPQVTMQYVRDNIRAPLYVGPFQVPWTTPTDTRLPPNYYMPDPTKAPAELAQLASTLQKDWGDPHFSVTGMTVHDAFPTVDQIAADWPDCPGSQKSYLAWMKAFGVTSGNYYWNMLPTPLSQQMMKLRNTVFQGAVQKIGYPIVPIGTFTHPVDGQKWGVYTALVSGPGRISSNSVDIATSGGCPYTPSTGALGQDVGAMQLQYLVAPTDYMKKWFTNRLQDSSTIASIGSVLESIWNAVTEIANFIGDVAVGIAEGIGALACGALQNPNAVKGATTAGGPEAGAGALIGQQLCGGPPAPPPPPQTDTTTILLLAGAGLAAVLLLTKKKKKPPAPSGSTGGAP